MTLIGSFNNLSRSIGVAVLVATSGATAVAVLGVEFGVYFCYKLARGDFQISFEIRGVGSFVLSLLYRLGSKVVADSTNCFHCRHPKEMGGLAFSASMVWGQIFPFVALLLFEGGDEATKRFIRTTLICCCSLWVALNILFFNTIEREYLRTFFSTKTASQYVE